MSALSDDRREALEDAIHDALIPQTTDHRWAESMAIILRNALAPLIAEWLEEDDGYDLLQMTREVDRAKRKTLREAANDLDRRAGEFRHLPGDKHIRKAHADIAQWLRRRSRLNSDLTAPAHRHDRETTAEEADRA